MLANISKHAADLDYHMSEQKSMRKLKLFKDGLFDKHYQDEASSRPENPPSQLNRSPFVGRDDNNNTQLSHA